MSSLTLSAVEAAIRSSWSVDTCDPAAVHEWSSENPSRGQCGSTALVLHDLLGGELLYAEVLYPDGSRQGHYYWNRLVGGVEVDLTAEQFHDDELVQPPRVVARPPGPPRRCAHQYLLLRCRVFEVIGRVS